MGCKYYDDEMAVFHGWFRGLRVRDMKNGRVLIPTLQVKAQVLRTWSALPSSGISSRKALRLAEWHLFRDCGKVTLNPDDPIWVPMLGLSVPMLTKRYRELGEIAALQAD